MRIHWIEVLMWGLVLVGCGPRSSSEFQEEGARVCQALADSLASIETSEQLRVTEPDLKKKFDSLVVLMIEAARFQESHADEQEEEGIQPLLASTSLQEQLRRIYTLEGGRESVERAQHESLVKLDAYERSCKKLRDRIKD